MSFYFFCEVSFILILVHSLVFNFIPLLYQLLLLKLTQGTKISNIDPVTLTNILKSKVHHWYFWSV